MTKPPPAAPPRRRRLLPVLLLLICGGITLLTVPGIYLAGDRFGYHRGYGVGLREGRAQELEARTLQRRPGVQPRLDVPPEQVERALTELSGPAPEPAFAEALDRVYRSLILEIGRAYTTEPGQERRALAAYAEVSAEVVEQHHAQLWRWRQARHPLPGTTGALEHHSAAVDLHLLLKDEACTVVGEAWARSAVADTGAPRLPGMCALLLKEIIAPWAAELEDLALDRDVETTVSGAETRHKRAIMELATSEAQIEGVVRHDFESTLFEGWPIEARDRATLEVRGLGIVKAGFRLQDTYEVTVLPDEDRIVVVLPRAEILSNTLVPQFSREREGWWTKLDTQQRNQAIRALQGKVEAHARTQGLLQDAEARAEQLIQDLYAPLIWLPGSSYQVEVAFSDAPQTPAEP
ncbi:MAG TPA: DUF4230 domain-containing protein [Deltaproteobacteria bacterium]|nr:DUF4230 domain-containing protein [Deltaproteobacteria bacterium]